MKKNHLLSLILVAFHISVFADVQVGQTSPNIDGKLIDGESFSLQARKGKVVSSDGKNERRTCFIEEGP